MAPSALASVMLLLVMSVIANAAPDNTALFNLCPPDERMNLVVEDLTEHATQGGLTREQISNAAESRLRAAGLYDPKAMPLLYVSVNVLPPEKASKSFSAYSIEVSYARLLVDPRIPVVGLAKTWSTSSVGQGYSSYIVSSLSKHLDRFLVEYLRVRDSEACKRLRSIRAAAQDTPEQTTPKEAPTERQRLEEFCAEVPQSALCRDL